MTNKLSANKLIITKPIFPLGIEGIFHLADEIDALTPQSHRAVCRENHNNTLLDDHIPLLLE